MKETEAVAQYIANRIMGWKNVGYDRDSAADYYQQLLVNLRDEHGLTDDDVQKLDAFFTEFFPSPTSTLDEENL